MNPKTVQAVFVGILIGFTLSVITEYLTETTAISFLQPARPVLSAGHQQAVINENLEKESQEPSLNDHLDKVQEEDKSLNVSDMFPAGNLTSELIHQEERELSTAMSKSIRILCWVMTWPQNHKDRALSVRATWGKRCNVLFFVSSKNVTLPENDTTWDWSQGPPLVTAIYEEGESRDVLWGKTKLGFKYAYQHYFQEADWFMKADDDTYVVMDNLRLLLLDKDPATPIYYGCKFKVIVTPNGYMSGGAGYVLSKEALKRLVEQGFEQPDKCRPDAGGAEDAEIGRCLQNLGVAAGDNRDSQGYQRFFPFTPYSHVNPDVVDPNMWYWQYIYYNHSQNMNCCSDSVISFHYVDRPTVWAMEYLIYHVHPFGVHPRLTGSHIKHQLLPLLRNKQPCNITKSSNKI